jgi:hypothetical protein
MLASRFRTFVLAATGLLLTGSAAMAQPGYYESRDLRKDYVRAERLRADIARDRQRMERARYYGNFREADRIARDMYRDQAKLEALERDIRRDQRGYR